MPKPLVFLIFTVLAVGCAASWFPGPRQVEQFDPPPGGSALERSTRIEYTSVLRPGEAGWVELTVLPVQEGGRSPETITARLALPGIAAKPEEIGQVAAAKELARFHWEMTSNVQQKVEGKLWLYSGADRGLVWVKPLQVEVRGPGMSVIWALRVGLLLSLAACAVYLVFVIKSTYSISIR
jgi:hypothetical protein